MPESQNNDGVQHGPDQKLAAPQYKQLASQGSIQNIGFFQRTESIPNAAGSRRMPASIPASPEARRINSGMIR